MATMGRGGGLGLLVVVTLLALLVAPHAAPALQPDGVGGLLRQAPDLLPEPPKLRPPDGGAAGGGPVAARRVVVYALAQHNKPYRWGHEGPDAFDCSGLAWAAWRAAGLQWPRLTADGQWRRGPRVHDRPRPGDLVFFHTSRMSKGHAGHVGVYLGDRRMVEAPAPGTKVRVGSTDRPGYLGATRPGGRGGS
jgi:cell wall-associated NlpC family hydrolase